MNIHRELNKEVIINVSLKVCTQIIIDIVISNTNCIVGRITSAARPARDPVKWFRNCTSIAILLPCLMFFNEAIRIKVQIMACYNQLTALFIAN